MHPRRPSADIDPEMRETQWNQIMQRIDVRHPAYGDRHGAGPVHCTELLIDGDLGEHATPREDHVRMVANLIRVEQRAMRRQARLQSIESHALDRYRISGQATTVSEAGAPQHAQRLYSRRALRHTAEHLGGHGDSRYMPQGSCRTAQKQIDPHTGRLQHLCKRAGIGANPGLVRLQKQ